jgi:hypothetical protein
MDLVSKTELQTKVQEIVINDANTSNVVDVSAKCKSV